MTYEWSDWDPAKMISQFSEAMASNPDGIAVMGHPGDDAFDPLIDQARGQGILVTVIEYGALQGPGQVRLRRHRLRRRGAA